MKKILAVKIFVLLAMINSQAQTIEWFNEYNDTKPALIREIDVDKSGNIIAVGFFFEELSFDNNGIIENIPSYGKNDILIQKLTSNGNVIWTKTIGGAEDEMAYGVDTDEFGNIYVSGRFTASVNFDPLNSNTTIDAIGPIDTYILKLNPDGEFVWVKQVGGNGGTIALDLVYDSENLIITGRFENVVDFDPGIDAFNVSSNGNLDAYILKLNKDGEFIWINSLGGTIGELGISSVVDGDGNIYTTGTTSSSFSIDLIDGGSATVTNQGISDIYVVKFNSEGEAIWLKSYGGTGSAIGFDVDVDNNGHLFLVGQVQDSCFFENDLITVDGTNALIMKLDSDGVIQWINSLGGNLTDVGRSVSVNNYNEIYVCGEFQDTMNLNSNQYISNGASDNFILKMTNSGETEWINTFGGESGEVIFTVVTDESTGIYCGGHFQESIILEVNSIVENFTSSGFSDGFLLKINSPFNNNGIDQINNVENYAYYPNPTTDQITIQSESVLNNTFKIYDQQGREVMNEKLTGKNTEVSLGKLSRGTYTIQLDGNYKPAVIIKE